MNGSSIDYFVAVSMVGVFVVMVLQQVNHNSLSSDC